VKGILQPDDARAPAAKLRTSRAAARDPLGF
jgi:hypothetical protein